MKFRTDFVTNSSSSSFAEIMIDNLVLLEILEKYKKMGAFVRKDGRDLGTGIGMSEEEAKAKVPCPYFGKEKKNYVRSKKPLAFCYCEEYEARIIDFAPDSIEFVALKMLDAIDEFRILEKEKNPIFLECKNEIKERSQEITNAYTVVSWTTSYEDTEDTPMVKKSWKFHYDKKNEEGKKSTPIVEDELKKCWSTKKNKDGTLSISAYRGKESSVIIPSEISGSKVSVIYKFGKNKILKEVIIPECVIRIDPFAFADCNKLEYVTILGTNTDIHSAAFNNTPWFKRYSAGKDFVIVNNMLIEYRGKDSCPIIPEGVTVICSNCFRSNDSIKNISVPDSVERICSCAFERCLNLEQIEIPDSVTCIESGAFSWCKRLENIVIPEGITSISDFAFYNCERLESIKIPESVTSIGTHAFSACKNLKEVIMSTNTTKMSCHTFERSENVVICAPKGSYAEKFAKRNKIPFKTI